MKRAVFLFCFAAVLSCAFAGCRLIRIEEEEPASLDYTIVGEQELPEELADLIEEKKEKEFQLTYESGEDLYLVKGYGVQLCGGYSIQVETLVVTSNAILFRTRLLGPEDQTQAGEPSYPFIVVRISGREEPVEFQ
ncbi:MAG: protease complex subunit PrcB family protein [Clostridiales bacterium]|nr:protease complex subunit PrcB family protein [Clostridiales bacterium]